MLAAASLVASLSGRTVTLPRCWDEGDQGQPNTCVSWICWWVLGSQGRKMNGALLSERGNSVLIRMSNPLPALSRNHFDRMVVISDLYLSYPWLLQSDPWAEWCSHHHHNIHWTDRTWLQYQPDKFQLTGPRWRSWTLLDWRRLISVTWRSWTIRMRKSVGTTTTSLYTSRVLHLGDIIVVNTNVWFHSTKIEGPDISVVITNEFDRIINSELCC